MIIPIAPVAKPRMTRQDIWKSRPCVIAYWQFKDNLKLYLDCLPPIVDVVFGIPIPKSWSDKRKKTMLGKPHQQRPDLDNLIKSFFDAIEDEDSHIHSISASKVWDYSGFINLKNNMEHKYKLITK